MSEGGGELDDTLLERRGGAAPTGYETRLPFSRATRNNLTKHGQLRVYPRALTRYNAFISHLAEFECVSASLLRRTNVRTGGLLHSGVDQAEIPNRLCVPPGCHCFFCAPNNT